MQLTAQDVGAYLLRAVVACLAFALALRRPRHSPIAVYLISMTILDVARWRMNAGPLSHPGPYFGFDRLIFHAEQAAFLAWPAGAAAVAWRVYLRKLPTPILVVYLLTLAVVIVAYPRLRGAPLGWVYMVAHASGAVAVLACALRWTRERKRTGEAPGSEHATILLIALLDLVLLFGPYPAPFEGWTLAQLLYAITWLGLAVLHTVCLLTGYLAHPTDRRL